MDPTQGFSFWASGTSNGNVGIGTTSPGYKLEVQGTAYATGAAGSLSDLRHKRNISSLPESSLEQILSLHPVRYSWRNPSDEGMKGTQMGFIAQEVQELIPSAVLTANNEERTLGLKYNELIAVFAKAFQQFFQKWTVNTEKVNQELLQTKAELSQIRGELEKVKQDYLNLQNHICKLDSKARFCEVRN